MYKSVRCVSELDIDLAPCAVDRLSVEKVLRVQCVGTPATGGHGGSNQRAEQAGKQHQTAAYKDPASPRRTRAGVARPRQRRSTAPHDPERAPRPAPSPFPRFLSASSSYDRKLRCGEPRGHRIREDYETSSPHRMLVQRSVTSSFCPA